MSLEPIEMGKTVTALCTIDIPGIVNTFKTLPVGRRRSRTAKPVVGNFHTYSTPEPLGVVACITPFNFSSIPSVNKFAPALAFGITIVQKPAEKTPLGAIKLVEIIHEAGMPAGVSNGSIVVER